MEAVLEPVRQVPRAAHQLSIKKSVICTKRSERDIESVILGRRKGKGDRYFTSKCNGDNI